MTRRRHAPPWAKLAAQLRSGGASLRPISIPGTEAAVGIASSGLPVVLDIASARSASGRTKFVIGFGEASVAAALNPPSLLSSAAPAQRRDRGARRRHPAERDRGLPDARQPARRRRADRRSRRSPNSCPICAPRPRSPSAGTTSAAAYRACESCWVCTRQAERLSEAGAHAAGPHAAGRRRGSEAARARGGAQRATCSAR